MWETWMAIATGVAAVAAVVAAGTGISNLSFSIWQYRANQRARRAQMKVSTGFGYDAARGQFTIEITVVNLSNFRFKLARVGLLSTKPESIYLAGVTSEGTELPVWIEPHGDVKFTVPSAWVRLEEVSDLDCAYAETVCGETAFSNRREARELIKELRQDDLSVKRRSAGTTKSGPESLVHHRDSTRSVKA